MSLAILRPICWTRTLWYTLQRPDFFKDGIPIMGHSYYEQDDGSLVCKTCGDKA